MSNCPLSESNVSQNLLGHCLFTMSNCPLSESNVSQNLLGHCFFFDFNILVFCLSILSIFLSTVFTHLLQIFPNIIFRISSTDQFHQPFLLSQTPLLLFFFKISWSLFFLLFGYNWLGAHGTVVLDNKPSSEAMCVEIMLALSPDRPLYHLLI